MKRVLMLFVVLFLISCVSATDYYVDATNGDDNLNGLSDANAWKTIGKVNNYNFQTGDDVYFKCGETWSIRSSANKLRIDWIGTPSDYVTIGSYYMEGNIEKHGINQHGRPFFEGGFVDFAPSLVLIDTAADLGDSYILFENLGINNSYVGGIRIEEGSNHNIIRNLRIDFTGQSAIKILSNYNKVEYCEVSNAGQLHKQGLASFYPGSIGALKRSYNEFRYNYVHDTHGEGITPGRQGLAEYNKIVNSFSVGIYLDGGYNSTVRYNLILGTTNPEDHSNTLRNGRYWHGDGIKIDDEGYGYIISSNHSRVYGNIVIGRYSGIRISSKAGWLNHEDLKVYNNLLIDNYYNFMMWGENNWTDVDIKNNIAIVTNQGSTYCSQGTDLGTWPSTWSKGYNLWNSPPETEYYNSATDIIADPKLYKSDGWINLASIDNFVTSDFFLQDNSPAINNGTNLGLKFSKAITIGTDFHETPPNVFLTNKNDYGNWDIGAYEYISESVLICSLGDNNPPDGIVSIQELIDFISLWKSGGATIQELIQVIGFWKGGC